MVIHRLEFDNDERLVLLSALGRKLAYHRKSAERAKDQRHTDGHTARGDETEKLHTKVARMRGDG